MRASGLMATLESLRAHAVVSDLDVAFARYVAGAADGAPDSVLLAACLASAVVGEGDVCADLRRFAGRPPFRPPDGADLDVPAAPDLSRWRAALRDSPVVGRPGEAAPLVLDDRDRLYLHRYWAYEQEIARDLLRRASEAPDADADRLAAALDEVFGREATGDGAGEPAPDAQRAAVATAASRRLCVISGGPGTGKTTTIVRLLAVLALLGRDGDGAPGGGMPAVALAAPTGKAAARMQEAIRQAKTRLSHLPPDALAAIPEQASTIHRLLGPRLESIYFRHDRENPLPHEVLVVDEASMVDVALMAKLLRALRPHAKLVLVGDRDQLASVEAGAVLGDVCGPAAPDDSERPTAIAAARGVEMASGGGSAAGLRGCIALLHHSFRFGPESGIGALARAVDRGRGAAALELVESGRFADAGWRAIDTARDLRDGLRAAAVEGYGEAMARARAGAPVAAVFEAFNRFRVLCAARQGDFGVERVNETIAELLHEAGIVDRRSEWYAGRPVMIARNDYQLHLFNGDVGIALADPDGRIRVHFEPIDGRERAFPPGRLPSHEPVFAMTVHKSQGSEFDRVLLLLPPEGSRILGRELVYTGITRARSRVDVWGHPRSFLEATERPLARSSGLRDALWGEEG